MANSVGQNLRRFNLKKVFLAVGVVVLAAAAGFFWWTISVSPVNLADNKTQTFVVAKGDGVREIAKNLKDSGLIRDPVAFFLLVRFQLNNGKDIQAGTFNLSPSMPAAEIANSLTIGLDDMWILIPEGWRSEEIITYLQSVGVSGDPGNWKADEGKYFPARYSVPKTITMAGVKTLMRQTFDQKTAGLNVDEKTLILASLVEREAKTETDRPIVAGILENRLAAGMPLQVDATVQYAVGKTGNWWKRDLTQEDLDIVSPYNTYLNSGLPPAPICNPGLSSIKAALSPAKTDYLYYLTDSSGVMHYAKTLSEHNQNVAKYL
ncbi:MAG: endolytic transglycosylase MltG [Patescibacteria group bacterium]|nr:endolytic transglycosylase MltG [Patescibacteria group bacterium]MCL5432444.1 endolytic transglycosylase MltG [Patescibacteria group bacterium]